jgi:hypothetical protein
MFGYTYPFYRSPYNFLPGTYIPGYPYYGGGSYFNAFQSQIGNQSVINTGVASGINQVFSPTAIY